MNDSAPRDEHIRRLLSESYAESRTIVAGLLQLGDDDVALALASALLATADGLLIQSLIDPDRAPTDADLLAALERLARLLASSR